MWWVLWINGILLVLAGLILATVPMMAAFAWLYIFGIMLAIAGVLGLFGAFFGLSHGIHSVTAFVGPILALILGVLFVDAPQQSAITITEFAGALALIATALGLRGHDGWIGVLGNGVMTTIAGILIVMWPDAALFVFAIFFGVQLIFSGFRMCAIGSHIRRLSASHQS
jgi:uncharacterized membrane protein HdeD (DUF308 family)